MAADFTKLLAHLGANLEAHAERDYPGQPVRQAVFLARGGHAPGEVCPTAGPPEPVHSQFCDLMWNGDDAEGCDCGAEADGR